MSRKEKEENVQIKEKQVKNKSSLIHNTLKSIGVGFIVILAGIGLAACGGDKDKDKDKDKETKTTITVPSNYVDDWNFIDNTNVLVVPKLANVPTNKVGIKLNSAVVNNATIQDGTDANAGKWLITIPNLVGGEHQVDLVLNLDAASYTISGQLVAKTIINTEKLTAPTLSWEDGTLTDKLVVTLTDSKATGAVVTCNAVEMTADGPAVNGVIKYTVTPALANSASADFVAYATSTDDYYTNSNNAQATYTNNTFTQVQQLAAPQVEFIDGNAVGVDDIVRITVDLAKVTSASEIFAEVNGTPIDTITHKGGGVYEAVTNGLLSGADAVTIEAYVSVNGYTDSEVTTITSDNHIYTAGDVIAAPTVSWNAANKYFTIGGLDAMAANISAGKATYSIQYGGSSTALANGNTRFTPTENKNENGKQLIITVTPKTVVSNYGYTHTVHTGGGTAQDTVAGLKSQAASTAPTVTWSEANKTFTITNNQTGATWSNYAFTFNGATVNIGDSRFNQVGTNNQLVFDASDFHATLDSAGEEGNYTFAATLNQFEKENTVYSSSNSSASFTYTYNDPGTGGGNETQGAEKQITNADFGITMTMLQNAVDKAGDVWERAALVSENTNVNRWGGLTSLSDFDNYLKQNLKIEDIDGQPVAIEGTKFLMMYDPASGTPWYSDTLSNTDGGNAGMVIALKYSVNVDGYDYSFYAKLDLQLNCNPTTVFDNTGATSLSQPDIGSQFLEYIWENSSITKVYKQTTQESYSREEGSILDDDRRVNIFFGDEERVLIDASDPNYGNNPNNVEYKWTSRKIDIDGSLTNGDSTQQLDLRVIENSTYSSADGFYFDSRNAWVYVKDKVQFYRDIASNTYKSGTGDNYTETIFTKIVPTPGDGVNDPEQNLNGIVWNEGYVITP